MAKLTGGQDVDAYIAGFEGVAKERLQDVRRMICEVLPEAEERLSYGMPAYFMNKRVVIYYSGFAHHIGIYPGRVATGDLAGLIGPYLSGKSTARFTHNLPLPEPIIKKLVQFRKQEVLAAAK